MASCYYAGAIGTAGNTQSYAEIEERVEQQNAITLVFPSGF